MSSVHRRSRAHELQAIQDDAERNLLVSGNEIRQRNLRPTRQLDFVELSGTRRRYVRQRMNAPDAAGTITRQDHLGGAPEADLNAEEHRWESGDATLSTASPSGLHARFDFFERQSASGRESAAAAERFYSCSACVVRSWRILR